MTKYFIERGADPNARSHYGETPLHFALGKAPSGPTENGNKDHWNDSRCRIEDSLDHYDHTSDDETDYGETKSTLERMRLQIVEALLFHENIDLDVKCDQGLGILHCLSYQKDGFESTEILPRILSKDATVDARDSEGQTALHLACRAGNERAVQLLIKKGANVMAIHHRGQHCLHHAAHGLDLMTLKVVMRVADKSHRTFPNLRDARGWSPLHHLLGNNVMSSFCDTEAIDLLIANGSSVNDLSNRGESPVAVYLGRHFISGSRAARVADCLFSVGADPFYRTADEGGNYGHLAAHCVELDIEVLKTLQRHGVRLDEKDKHDRTILHHCAQAGSLASSVVMTFLCESVGLSPTAHDRSGKSPLDIANETIAELDFDDLYQSNERWQRTADLLASYPTITTPVGSKPESHSDEPRSSKAQNRSRQGNLDPAS
jgi:ankyrin repeat protein